jgi:hypothetical protein
MKHGKTIIFLSGIVVGAAVVVWAAWPRQPAYRGIRLNESFYHMGAGGNTDDDAVAFINFGTNALPYLRKALQARDTEYRRLLVWFGTRQTWIKIRMRPATETHQTALLAYKGFLEAVDEGFAEPSAAEACVPQITALLKDRDPLTREMARDVLAMVEFIKRDASRRRNAK